MADIIQRAVHVHTVPRRAGQGAARVRAKANHKRSHAEPRDHPKVGQFCEKVNAQLTLYRTKKGTFAREWVMASAEKMPAYLWWDANGASCPELAAVRGASRPRPACLGLYLRAHQLGVRVHQGPAAQQAAARQGKQARGHLPQPPPPHTHEQAQLRGASRRMELRAACHRCALASRRDGLQVATQPCSSSVLRCSRSYCDNLASLTWI